MNNNEWKKVCAACAEGTPPERCAYYGDPDGCNAPTLGKHPEGDLAERLQESLEKAESRIAELERASGNVAAMRAVLTFADSIDVSPEVLEETEDWESDVASFVDDLQERAKAALEAPARNCDRTKDEAESAFKAKFGRPWSTAEDELATWLFAEDTSFRDAAVKQANKLADELRNLLDRKALPCLAPAPFPRPGSCTTRRTPRCGLAANGVRC